MKTAFSSLDRLVPKNLELIAGGGGAMILAHDFPLVTTDVDALVRGMSIDEMKPFIEAVAKELGFENDWLNPWFGSFTHVLPVDYASRLIEVFLGERLVVRALGDVDLLIMKCFAHRQKDIAHARALVKRGVSTDLVYSRIEELDAKKIPGSPAAKNFLEEILEMEGR